MSSRYAILGNRPLDQWKVTELKEELKRRKLTTRGLKEDLVKRLDEAVRTERQSTKTFADDNDLSGFQPEGAKEETMASQSAFDSADNAIGTTENEAALNEKGTDGGIESSVEPKVVEVNFVQEADGMQAEIAAAAAAVEDTILKNQAVEPLESLGVTHIDALSHFEGLPPEDRGATEGQNEEVIRPKSQMDNDDFKCTQLDSSMQPKTNQVSKVDSASGFEVTSNSVATEPIAVIEKHELNIDVINGNNHLELDAKPEIVQSSPSSIVVASVDVPDDMNNALVGKGVDTREFGSEKLNLDRSSGDDSMEDDVPGIKQVDAEPELTKGIDDHFPNQLEDDDVDVVGHYNATETGNADQKTDSQSTSVKRKLVEPTFKDEPVKKVRRWNTGDLKSSEPQIGNALPVSIPKGPPGASVKHSSENDSVVETEHAKERIVPPSSKPPTNSLRIDRFLRPFTHKAVQELLGRTGTVVNFWMDQIKTHCYVSYSSVEEAEKTRNAVYNLQWPPNGGHLLVADFVDPQEVKARLEAPPTPPATSIAPAYQPHPNAIPKPSAHATVPRQQPPLSSVPPPPPPFSGRERPHPSREQPMPAGGQSNLPPPPPLPEKVDPPILTLDDFFRKTRSSPRIYYLPLSDEQVAAKIRASGKNSTLHQ